MPELPEVETIKNQLNSLLLSNKKAVLNKKVVSFYRSDKKLRYGNSLEFDRLLGAKITTIARRARYLIINFSNQLSLIFHFGMSGTLKFSEYFNNQELHQHFALKICDQICDQIFVPEISAINPENGTESIKSNWLIFRDPRRFGMVDLIQTADLARYKHFVDMGLEPLEGHFNPEYLAQKLACDGRPIKTAIMDNKIVVGVGNIYANESLFLAKILPLKKAKDLKPQEIVDLVAIIKTVLNIAIDSGGSSISDFVSLAGGYGMFQEKFRIYGRFGEPCFSCNDAILKTVIASRSTFFCKNCQF
jgi:formamidopyrimidine-DNA glycosylase